MKGETMPLESIMNRLIAKLSPPVLVLAPAGSRPSGSNGTGLSANVALMSSDREEVEVTRRRTGEGGPRERADAPRRSENGKLIQAARGRSVGGGGGGGGGVAAILEAGALVGLAAVAAPAVGQGFLSETLSVSCYAYRARS